MGVDMKFAITVAAICLAGEACAEAWSGNEVHRLCTSDAEAAKFAYCLGLVDGWVEGIAFGSYFTIARSDPNTSFQDATEFAKLSMGYCIPEDVTRQQIVSVFFKHLEENPETRHDTARMIFHRSMIDAFPCE